MSDLRLVDARDRSYIPSGGPAIELHTRANGRVYIERADGTPFELPRWAFEALAGRPTPNIEFGLYLADDGTEHLGVFQHLSEDRTRTFLADAEVRYAIGHYLSERSYWSEIGGPTGWESEPDWSISMMEESIEERSQQWDRRFSPCFPAYGDVTWYDLGGDTLFRVDTDAVRPLPRKLALNLTLPDGGRASEGPAAQVADELFSWLLHTMSYASREASPFQQESLDFQAWLP